MSTSDGRSWRSEPLLHFVVLGGLLFAVSSWRDRADDDGDMTVKLGAVEQARITEGFTKQQGRAPSADEQADLVRRWTDTELLYREGIRLGLDRGDPTIRRRIVEKMKFIAGEEAIVGEPDDAALQAFVDAHAAQYAGPPRRDFTLVSFGGPDAKVAATQAQAKLRGGAAPGDVGGRVATAKRFTPSNTVGTYGQVIADAVLSAEAGEWGLVQLPNGWSLLKVGEAVHSDTPPLDKVRNQALRGWTANERAKAIAKRVAGLREQYQVVIESGEAP